MSHATINPKSKNFRAYKITNLVNGKSIGLET